MKSSLHPQYNTATVITCSCGSKITTGSTKGDFHIDICSKCHPFFTGEQRFVDTQGRVEKFQQRQKMATAPKKAKRRIVDTTPQSALSLKEMLSKKA